MKRHPTPSSTNLAIHYKRPAGVTQNDHEALLVASSIITGIGDAALLLDTEFNCLCFSRQFAQLVGLRPNAVERQLRKGTPFLDLFQKIEFDQSSISTCLNRGTRICMYDVAGIDIHDNEFLVIVTLLPVTNADRSTVGILCILRDVTAEVGLQINYKEQLVEEKKRADQLERIVHERTVDLQNALQNVTSQAQELKESRQREVALQKSVFAGRLATGLAHEFNSPLACILANQEYLRSRLEEISASITTPSADWMAFFNESMEILDEDAGSMKRLSTTVSTLQGFCLTSAPAREDIGLTTCSAHELLLDTQQTLAGSSETYQDIEFILDHDCRIIAYQSEVSLAIVALIRFLQDYESAESKQTYDELLSSTATVIANRRIQVRTLGDDAYGLIGIYCKELTIDIDEAESAFDPSLVVDNKNRIKLSIDLSVCAARIARSGGNVQFSKSEKQGTMIEVRLKRSLEDVPDAPTPPPSKRISRNYSQ